MIEFGLVKTLNSKYIQQIKINVIMVYFECNKSKKYKY